MSHFGTYGDKPEDHKNRDEGNEARFCGQCKTDTISSVQTVFVRVVIAR